MPRAELEKLLASLRAESAHLEETDPASVGSIQGLIAELEKELQESESGSSAGGLPDLVQQELERFEASHPRITGILNDILVKLSGMGI